MTVSDAMLKTGATAALPAALLGLFLSMGGRDFAPAWLMISLGVVAVGGISIMIIALLVMMWET